MTMRQRFVTSLGMTFMALAVLGCEQKGPAQRAGEKIDETAEKVGEKIEEVGEKVEEAGKKVQETAKD